jgi:hypothetical protein
MPPCIEKARAIMRVMAVDMWNHKAKHERTRLWRMYCSPQIKAYTPDGGETTGYEEVGLPARETLQPHSRAAELTTNKQCDSNYDKLHAENRADWKFELTGDLYLIGNTFMQTWFFGKGIEGWEGWNVITVNNRGEVVSLHGVVEDAQRHSIRREDEPANPPPVVALDCSTFVSVAGRGEFEAPGRWTAA